MTTEDRLRAALRAGADVITDAHLPDELPPRRRPVAWLAVAAAAVVVLTAALAIGLRGSGTAHPDRPADTRPPSSTAPTKPPTQRTVVDGIHAQSCTVPLPATWRRAIAAGHVGPPDGKGIDPRAVDSAGDVIAAQRYDVSNVQSVSRYLYRIRPGHQPEKLYTAPRDDRLGGVATDGDWVIFGIVVGGGQGALAGIDALDLRTSSLRVVRGPELGVESIVTEPVVAHGIVYWSETTSAGIGHVYSYDLATGAHRTLDHGRIGGPVAAAGGVYWQRGTYLVTHVAGDLPPGFQVNPFKRFNVVVTGGAVQAWSVQSGRRDEIRMRRGHGDPVTVETSRHADEFITPTGIVGPYLVSGSEVLDTRTGALTSLPASDYGGVYADRAMIAFTSGTIHRPGVVVLDTAHLPGLHC